MPIRVKGRIQWSFVFFWTIAGKGSRKDRELECLSLCSRVPGVPVVHGTCASRPQNSALHSPTRTKKGGTQPSQSLFGQAHYFVLLIVFLPFASVLLLVSWKRSISLPSFISLGNKGQTPKDRKKKTACVRKIAFQQFMSLSIPILCILRPLLCSSGGATLFAVV